MADTVKIRLEELRKSLLRLHKTLLDGERKIYEAKNGPISSAGQVLHLVMNDPWFDWLHQISRFIVRIDEAQEDDGVGTPEWDDSTEDLIEAAREMILPKDGEETEFMGKYKAILRMSPDAVIAHAAVLKALHPATDD